MAVTVKVVVPSRQVKVPEVTVAVNEAVGWFIVNEVLARHPFASVTVIL